MRRVFILLFLAIFQFTFSQTGDVEIARKILQAERLDGSIKIDGDLDDAAWSGAAVASNFTERNPTNGRPEPVEYRSVVKVLYDDTGIYFGAELFDPNPSNIAKELTERDDLGNDDAFGITLNGYNDHQQSLMFIVQASGVQADAKLLINSNDDFTWNAVWYSAVKITAKGWNVEIKIPYSELRFPKKEVQQWGLNLLRMVQRSNSQYTWNFVDNKKGSFMLYDGTLSGIENISPPTRLAFLPYFSAYANRYDGKNSFNVNGGMDLKYGINDSFTLDLTLIPDFGQANFDEAINNLGPFEQQFEENRPFFTEGTELFNKGNLFYSRRIGGGPTRAINTGDYNQILINPERVKLFNALKISGRTNKGLGIGFFNAITEKTEALVINKYLTDPVKVVTEPWGNYNVTVLDQRFRGNSSVTLVNTNVTRNGDFRDANVTALLADIVNKNNTHNIYGSLKESVVNDRGFRYGTEGKLGANKLDGAHRFGGSVMFRTKTYNIDDLGFTGGNNFLSFEGHYNYRYLKPRGNLNILNYRIQVNESNRIEPFLFSNLSIHQNFEIQNKKFQNMGLGLLLNPLGTNDIYEARTFGRHVFVPAMVNPWIFYNSDERKKLQYGGYTEVYVYNAPGRIRYVSELNLRYRFSDHFALGYEFDYDIYKNDQGFVGRDGSTIFIGRRDVNNFENALNAKYTFNDKMALNLSFRHYFSGVKYNQFGILNEDGRAETAVFDENRDGTYNFWNVDLRYSWWFAPGSQITVLYRNAADSYLDLADQKFSDNFDYLFSRPMLNNFSLKITYYLDYNRVMSWVKKS